MKKKGFTLIELLAVIIILAIIALIATPIVMNVIENSRKGAAERSADNYMDAVETAIATEKLDGKELEGTYVINADGDLCSVSEGVNCEKPITIDMSGNKPSSGTIVIENGIVTTESTMTVGEYIVSYDETKKTYVATIPVMYILEDIKNQTEADIIKYDPVANATCTSGTTCYSWYVLEDGDTTTLTSETGRIAQSGEVSLIMDRNISEEVAWCKEGLDNSCAADGALEALSSETKGWTVKVDLPTAKQMATVIGDTKWTDKTYTGAQLSSWLYGNLDNDSSTTTPSGYWTSTTGHTYCAWYVLWLGNLHYGYVDDSNKYGVRPVITISKTKLN